MFEVIPAIDIAAGRLAAYTRAGPEPSESFGGDPVVAARAYVEAGARWLHVVDLDRAFSGHAGNLGALRTIAGLGPPVQASGGIATVDQAQAALDAGARRIVLGSEALADATAALGTIGRFVGRVIVGIEVDDGRIRSRGSSSVELPLAETLGWLVAAGAPAFLVTAVARVGSLEGPDVAMMKRVLRSGRPVVAAGGIASIEDLRALRRAGAAGAVVGRAALEGGMDLGQALGIE